MFYLCPLDLSLCDGQASDWLCGGASYQSGLQNVGQCDWRLRLLLWGIISSQMWCQPNMGSQEL